MRRRRNRRGADEPTDGTVVDDPTDDDGSADDGTADDGMADDDPIDDPPLGAGPYPIADLTITYQLTPDGEPVVYQLACLGDTATRLDPASDDGGISADAECLALNDDAIRTRLIEGAPTDVMCTEEYGGPETATIVGQLDGEDVDTSFDRANGCGIGDWTLMQALLPAPA